MAEKNASENITETIYEMIEKRFQCKNTEYGVFVTVETANGKEDVPLKSDKFRSILANRYKKEYGKIAQSSKIKDCVFSFYGKVMEEYSIIKNSNRCERRDDGCLLIDSGNKEDMYFVVSKDGMKIKENGCRYFYKHLRKGEIPHPDIENGVIDRIFTYCRIPQDMKTVFIAYLVSLFIGDIEHPCLVLNGGQGSGKTTMSTFIKSLIDPVADSRPSLFPKNESDLALMFRDNYLLAFDNLQTLNTRLSDRLCTIVTGVTDSRRKLYTDDEMIHYNLCQPIILNGIHEIVKKEDMLSRSIVINLAPTAGKCDNASEKNLLIDKFMNDRPIILGGIFKILIQVLKRYKPNSAPRMETQIRMSSFYDYGYYICEAWEKGKGAIFCADYINLLDSQLKDFKKHSELVEIIRWFLEDNDFEWDGTMKDFSDDLNNFVEITNTLGDGNMKIPPSPNRLSRELAKLKDELEVSGILTKWSKTSNNSRYIHLSLEDE